MNSVVFEKRKTCSKCGVEKLLNDFNFRNRAKGTKHSYCRDCGKLLTSSHYKRNKQQYFDKNSRAFTTRREYVRRAKARPCSDCGGEYPFYVMDFDHREGETKTFELNQINRVTMRALIKEIAKCDLVCANCHRERTYQRTLNQPLE